LVLSIGGIDYPLCPFNGWYTYYEIGRDLCDLQRYNKLLTIANWLGFDTTISLWQDTALELNKAILHSFNKHRVTIVDHHNATESYMKHLKKELKKGRGVPGDWVWLVPPISGSLCPVFHQEMVGCGGGIVQKAKFCRRFSMNLVVRNDMIN